MNGGRLVLHIGLPKTATTFLQNGVLRHLAELDLIHRKQDRQSQRICTLLKRANSPRAVLARLELHRAAGRIRRYPRRNPTLVISSENISVSRTAFWTGVHVGPETVAARLGNLVAALRVPAESVRVMIGVRRQDRWLASRYAGSSASFPDFTQHDFERRARAIIDSTTPYPAIGWLEYDRVHAAFSSVFGAHALLFIPMERLKVDASGVMESISNLLGGIDLTAAYEANRTADGAIAARNVNSRDGESWPLRNGAGTLTLDARLASDILAHFGDSNTRFERATGVDYRTPL